MVSTRWMAIGTAVVVGAGVLSGAATLAQAPGVAGADPWTVDFRYAPPGWQTSICLPDDWQKTLVGKDGGLLYDFGGQHDGFKTKITVGLPGRSEWVRQELHAPRVPIVRTVTRCGPVQAVAETFAIAPRLGPEIKEATRPITIKRVGNDTALAGWAAPSRACDPGFRNIAVGWKEPIRYRFRAEAGARYTVAFGLCEGHHTATGQRVQHLQIEGKTRHTLDLVKALGHRVPAALPFPAKDENGDGWIDLAVAATGDALDKNTILNLLWVFREGQAPPADKLAAGPCPKSALGYLDCGGQADVSGPPRHDMLTVELSTNDQASAAVVPAMTIESDHPISPDPAGRRVRIGHQTTLLSAEPFEVAAQSPGLIRLHFRQVNVDARRKRTLVFCVARGRAAEGVSVKLSAAGAYRTRAEQFWKQVDLPYDRLGVPDAGIQALLDASVRNIYQAREIKKDLPAFQVGPTCYRGLWVVDGSFLMEAVTFLGRTEEAREGIKYLLGFQRDDGAVMIINGHLKETGIALWAVARHARLTGDKAWLKQVWPKVERGVAFIRQLRKTASAKPGAPNAGLIPDGFSDGGLGGKAAEYTNVYWTLAGMRSAVEAARWLGKTAQADDWQREYDDFYKTFRRAAKRDTRKDAHGNAYVPIRMVKPEQVAPQRAQWAFLHAVFPGQVFEATDPLVAGNMAMLEAVEREGLVYGTGWIADGIWNYFGSFYGHAWLWLGRGQKAARTLYAFANHASPLLCWREEQMPAGGGERVCGDMPHNWASAEFIRLVRHLLVLERGDELHLLEGVPARWARPNAVTRAQGVVTTFGEMTLELRIASDGSAARLRVHPPTRTPASRVVVHLDGWSGKTGTLVLPAAEPTDRRIVLEHGGAR